MRLQSVATYPSSNSDINISPEPQKLEALSKGGRVIGDIFIYGDGSGVEYTQNLKQLEIDSSAVFNKSDNRLNCSLSRHLFIDEDIGKEKAELNIDVTIRGNFQVFSERFRSKLSFQG